MSVMSRFAEMAEEDKSSENMLICPVHGEYPASLKAFGCPDCTREREEEEQEEEAIMNSRVARFNNAGRRR
jgi:hypothetical protein